MDAALLKKLTEERKNRQPYALVTCLSSNEQRLVKEADIASDPLAAEIIALFAKNRSACLKQNNRDVFVDIYMPPPQVLIIGAVHISQALAPMIHHVGLEPVIIDPRTAFATKERFPDVTLYSEWPLDVLANRPLDRFSLVAALTHDPKIDDDVLAAALSAQCLYIGALGSRTTHAKRVMRLKERGFGEPDIKRIHAPIGLDIGASSPSEIAVAILAEMISALRLKPNIALKRQ